MLPDPQSWNAYAYARNNPVNYTDPSGEVAVDDAVDGGYFIYDTGKWFYNTGKGLIAAVKGDFAAADGYFDEATENAVSALTDVAFAAVPGVSVAGVKLVDDAAGAFSHFSSVDELIQGATNMTRVKGGASQGFIKGDGASIFQALIENATKQSNGTYKLKDGTVLFSHYSSKTGEYTIDINKSGDVYKIRVTK